MLGHVRGIYIANCWLAAILWVVAVSATAQPNIVLIVAEDMSSRVGAFGDAVAQTPNIDALAEQGVRYTRVFSGIRCLRTKSFRADYRGVSARLWALSICAP